MTRKGNDHMINIGRNAVADDDMKLWSKEPAAEHAEQQQRLKPKSHRNVFVEHGGKYCVRSGACSVRSSHHRRTRVGVYFQLSWDS